MKSLFEKNLNLEAGYSGLGANTYGDFTPQTMGVNTQDMQGYITQIDQMIKDNWILNYLYDERKLDVGGISDRMEGLYGREHNKLSAENWEKLYYRMKGRTISDAYLAIAKTVENQIRQIMKQKQISWEQLQQLPQEELRAVQQQLGFSGRDIPLFERLLIERDVAGEDILGQLNAGEVIEIGDYEDHLKDAALDNGHLFWIDGSTGKRYIGSMASWNSFYNISSKSYTEAKESKA